MSTVPSVPPPTPPPLPVEICTPPVTPVSAPKYSAAFTYSHICKWASEHPQLWEVATKYNICSQKTPFKFKYKHFDSILQVGPTCGLVAMSMLVNGEVSPDEILNISKTEGYSCNGEMFSCRNMIKLMDKVLRVANMDSVNYNLKVGELFSHDTIEKLLNGAVLLVPYDADCNHCPCLRQGHTAHWAMVCGVVVMEDVGPSYASDPSNVYIFSRHGKSKYLAAWKIDELEKSNKNLWEFSPKKNADGQKYVLPEGGIGGEDGLRDQYLIIEGL